MYGRTVVLSEAKNVRSYSSRSFATLRMTLNERYRNRLRSFRRDRDELLAHGLDVLG